MELNRKIFKTELDGEEISIEVSELAGQTNASVIGKHGNTVVLATVVMGSEDRPGDFFPLTVDYEERFYAAGKIIGSRFVRREGRPSDEATLSARLIDRTIRPLFDHRLRREVQVTITILAYDGENNPQEIALLATSTALGISNIPWGGPVAGVREQSEGFYDAFFAGTGDRVNMIEFQGYEVDEKTAAKAFSQSHATIKELVGFEEKIIKEIGKPKTKIAFSEPDPKIKKVVHDFVKDDLHEAVR